MPSPGQVRVEGHDAVSPAELRAVEALAAAAAEADGRPALDDETRLALETPGDGAGVVLAWTAAGRGPVGAAVLTGTSDPRTVELAVHPAHRGAAEAVAPALVDGALAQASRHRAGSVRLWLRAPGPPDDAMALGRGFRAQRDLLQLRVPLPLDPGRVGRPAPVRPFRPGEDEGAWLAVNNRAFADHPEQSGWTLDDVTRREAEPWFDPQGFLLHEEGGRLAAFCWTKVHRAPPLGEIYVIGVDPAFQRRGLGRALTAAGLAHLAATGITTGMLYVEGSNTTAVELYRSLGFTRHHLDRAYLIDLPS